MWSQKEVSESEVQVLQARHTECQQGGPRRAEQLNQFSYGSGVIQSIISCMVYFGHWRVGLVWGFFLYVQTSFHFISI